MNETANEYDFEEDLDLYCSQCDNKLIVNRTGGPRGYELYVQPCMYCLNAAFHEGAEDALA